MSILEHYENADKAFRTRDVLKADSESLMLYLHGLANQNNVNSGTQHRDVIRGLTINHLLMQRHIDNLNASNQKTQNLVVALTVASLIGTAVQTYLALVPPHQPTAPTPQKQETKSATPTQLKPQAPDLPKDSKP